MERDKKTHKPRQPTAGPEGPDTREERALITAHILEKDAVSVAVPEGKIGELRCAFKADYDCMGVIYTKEGSKDFRVIGNCQDGTQTGDHARHRFSSGIWNMGVYNKTRTCFEPILKKTVHLKDEAPSFVLGATHRISATRKTCIVCVMEMLPE